MMHIIGSNSDLISKKSKKQRKFTGLSKILRRKNKEYGIVSKDGSLLFPALKAISNQSVPILKDISNFNNNHDEGKLYTKAFSVISHTLQTYLIEAKYMLLKTEKFQDGVE